MTRVLIVEDEALVAWNLESLVAESGYEVTGVAANSVQALETARAMPPDVALVDMNLADGMTGPAVAEALTREHGTVVVALTGHPRVVEVGHRGVRRVVPKPYTDDVVQEVLQWADGLVRQRPMNGADDQRR